MQRSKMQRLFDHLVGAQQDCRRKLDADRSGGFEVDDQLELRGLLDRQVGGLLALENLWPRIGGPPIHQRKVSPLSHSPARLGPMLGEEHGKEAVRSFSLPRSRSLPQE